MGLRRIPFAAIVATLALSAFTTPAATAAAASTRGAASSPAPASQRPHASREQLRECLDLGDELKRRHQAMDARTAAHEKAIDEVQAQGAKISEVQAQLDHENQTAITAFNLMVADYNVRTRELNQEVADFKVDTDAYNADSLAANRKCAALLYLPDDMAAVMKERKAAGK